MKTTKLVVGIIMIVLSVLIFFQASIAGLGNAVAGTGETSGSSGIFLAIMYLASGIVYICTRKKEGLGGDIAGLVMMVMASMMGFNAGSYSDLVIWSWLAFVIGVGFLVWHLAANKKAKNVDQQ